jgi:hypothetical protein
MKYHQNNEEKKEFTFCVSSGSLKIQCKYFYIKIRKVQDKDETKRKIQIKFSHYFDQITSLLRKRDSDSSTNFALKQT